jgi:predicted P-loop ATPase
MHREAIMGRGDLTWCEMTWRVRFGGRELSDVDLSSIRLGLESQERSTDGKPLKFSEEDIAKALTLLARRKSVHPVREWLNGLQWNRKQLIQSELPALLGHESGGFAASCSRGG